jgi:cytochrome c oxidase subunit IV
MYFIKSEAKMSNTNQKSFKFPVGAIFLLISTFWTLLEFLDSISLLSDYYMEAYYGIYAIISFISLGTTITLCVFLFMKKSGLALAIPSFAIAFSSLLGLFTPFAFAEYIGYIFTNEKDPIELMKYKNIAETFEAATDAAKRVSDSIRKMILRYQD